MPDTPLDLPKLAESAEKLRKLREKTTQGEWTMIAQSGYIRSRQSVNTLQTVADLRFKNGPSDAAYIAASHSANLESAVPLLIAEIERLRAAMLRYGFHEDRCTSSDDCICGWDELKRKLAALDTEIGS